MILPARGTAANRRLKEKGTHHKDTKSTKKKNTKTQKLESTLFVFYSFSFLHVLCAFVVICFDLASYFSLIDIGIAPPKLSQTRN